MNLKILNSIQIIRIVFLGLIVISIAVFFINVLKGRTGEIISGDGKIYYAWVRSVIIDKDVDFTNEFFEFHSKDYAGDKDRVTTLGLPENKYPVGLAFLESIPFLFAYITEIVFNIDPTAKPGYSPIYQWSVAIFLLLFILIPIYKFFIYLFNTSEKFFIVLLAIGWAGASNSIQYLTKNITSTTHMVNFSIIVFLWLLFNKKSLKNFHYVLIGFLFGLLFIVRATNLIFLPWLLVCYIQNHKDIGFKQFIAGIFGVIIPIFLQIAANLSLWGKLFPEPYPGENFFWTKPKLLDILFSIKRGWLLWHPWYGILILLFLVSWIYYRNTNEGKLYYGVTLLTILLLWYVNSSWWSWYFGSSFGHRAFIILTPILIVSIAQALPYLIKLRIVSLQLNKIKILFLLITLLLCVWNANLWAGYMTQSFLKERQPEYTECLLWFKQLKTNRVTD